MQNCGGSSDYEIGAIIFQSLTAIVHLLTTFFCYFSFIVPICVGAGAQHLKCLNVGAGAQHL